MNSNMRSFIEEKKGIIGFTLIVLSFLFITVFLFSKEGRAPERVINVLEPDEYDTVSRDTYNKFKEAVNAYKLNDVEDPGTRNLQEFLKEDKEDEEDEEDKKDENKVEDNGHDIRKIPYFDAKTAETIGLKSIYRSVEDGPKRESVMRRLQEVKRPFTAKQLEGLAEFFEQHKDKISSTEKDNIKKVIYFLKNGPTGKGIKAYQKALKQNAPDWVNKLKGYFLEGMPDIFGFLKNNMWSKSFTKHTNKLLDWLRGTWISPLLNGAIGFMDSLKNSFTPLGLAIMFFCRHCVQFFIMQKSTQVITNYEDYRTQTLNTSVEQSQFIYPLALLQRLWSPIEQPWIKILLAFGAVVMVCVLYYGHENIPIMKNYARYVILTPISIFLIGSCLYAIGMGTNTQKIRDIFLLHENTNTNTSWKMWLLVKLGEAYITLSYIVMAKFGIFNVAGFFGSSSIIVSYVISLSQQYGNTLKGVLFINRLRHIFEKMETLNKEYEDSGDVLPYLEDIRLFMNDKKKAAYCLISEKPVGNWFRENLKTFNYVVFGKLYYDIDKVMKDQQCKKALISFFELYEMTNELTKTTDYSLVKPFTEDRSEIRNPQLHIQGLHTFEPHKKEKDKEKTVSEEAEKKSSFTYDINIGHKSKAYLLIGDDEKVMNNYLACIGQNIVYTLYTGMVRGKVQRYIECDKIFCADGYKDTKKEHAMRLASIMTYARQHENERILVLVSNIYGKMSGEVQAALVHSYGTELKKLSNVTFIFSCNNMQDMYNCIDREKGEFTLLTPILNDQKATGGITIGRAEGHVKGIKVVPEVARKLRRMLKKSPDYKGHLQDYVTKDYRSSVLFIILMIFMLLGLILFVKRKK